MSHDYAVLGLFDGPHLEPADQRRLNTALARVEALMADSEWHTLREIADYADCSEAGASARLRDIRKVRFGGKQVDLRRRTPGVYEYRLWPPKGTG